MKTTKYIESKEDTNKNNCDFYIENINNSKFVTKIENEIYVNNNKYRIYKKNSKNNKIYIFKCQYIIFRFKKNRFLPILYLLK